MANMPAKVRQADVARCIRAARQAGAQEIEIRPDGTIVVRLNTTGSPAPVDDEHEVVL